MILIMYFFVYYTPVEFTSHRMLQLRVLNINPGDATNNIQVG